ncbi:hypothetical protein PQX77_002830 [Marasmius sp. AFHP31]|nr:hypothetical protein PQX77_021305 [Marasmius sp. AFHP31]KAK1233871.1 hypothetical protein PQX77_002959 [Marasmius sp. AFHP31]KAK1233980.1 hypothetical protein PQX77_002830 [Marasmius sp. AFHP31]
MEVGQVNGSQIQDVLVPSSSGSTKDYADRVFAQVRVICIGNTALEREPYPSKDVWMVELEAIRQKWEALLWDCVPADMRLKTKPIMMVDIKKIDYDITPDESVMFINTKGEVLFLVLRNFCSVKEVTAWCDKGCRIHMVEALLFDIVLKVMKDGRGSRVV